MKPHLQQQPQRRCQKNKKNKKRQQQKFNGNEHYMQFQASVCARHNFRFYRVLREHFETLSLHTFMHTASFGRLLVYGIRIYVRHTNGIVCVSLSFSAISLSLLCAPKPNICTLNPIWWNNNNKQTTILATMAFIAIVAHSNL